MDNENSTTTEESEGDEDTRHLDVMKKEVAIAKAHMLTHLQEFRYECRELQKLKEERNQEQLMSNRLIKTEIIDVADRLEIMYKIMKKN